MLIQKAIDSTLKIWEDALKDKNVDSDSKETLEYMIDAIANTDRLHKELERVKQQNIALIHLNASMFNILKNWLNVLENTPTDSQNTGTVLIDKETLAKIKEIFVNAGYKF